MFKFEMSGKKLKSDKLSDLLYLIELEFIHEDAYIEALFKKHGKHWHNFTDDKNYIIDEKLADWLSDKELTDSEIYDIIMKETRSLGKVYEWHVNRWVEYPRVPYYYFVGHDTNNTNKESAFTEFDSIEDLAWEFYDGYVGDALNDTEYVFSEVEYKEWINPK